MSTRNVVFIALLVLAAGFFSYNVQRLVSYLRLGRAEDRFDHPLQRLENVLVIAILQRKILRDPVAGPMHALIFWGFIALTAGTIELFLQGIFPAFSYRFLPTWAYRGYSVSQDVFGVLVLGAVSFALYRRLVVHPRRLEGDGLEHMDALIILGAIAGLMVTMFFANAFQIVLEPESVVREKFVSHALATALAGVRPSAASAARGVFWWTHAVLVLAFLNYLPYSKHLHIVSSIPNVYFSNANGPRERGAIRYMDLEAEGAEQFGASDVEHLTWKDLLDGYTCTECGRCTAACPANITGKVLSPRKIIINTRQRLLEKGPLLTGDRMEFIRPRLVHGEGADAGATSPGDALSHRLLDTYITEEELW